MDRAGALGYGKYIVSSDSPFHPADLALLRENTPAVVKRYYPVMSETYAALGWKMFEAKGLGLTKRVGIGEIFRDRNVRVGEIVFVKLLHKSEEVTALWN